MNGNATIAPGGSPGELRTARGSDAAELTYRFFAPAEGDHRGNIVHLHGIQSHSGWYVETAAELAKRGYAVYLCDRRGSGRSRAPRGDFAKSQQLVDDVGTIVDEAGEQPTVLIGGCWGARPAVAYTAQSPSRIAGLALVAPALKAKVDLTPQRKAQVFTRQGRVPIPLTPELFTDNQPYLDFVRNDPLSLHDVTARFFFSQFFWDKRLLAQRSLGVPVLMLQPGPDPVVDVDEVRAWYDQLAAPRKQVIRYEGFGHILDFAPERARFWNDLAGWLDEVTA